MKIIQVIKKLNNTEIGKNGTHETYIHVPQNLDIADLFPQIDTIENFIYKKNGKVYHIRYTASREKRIVGLGDFYRDNNVCAGDEVILEHHVFEEDSSYFIDLRKHENILMIQKCKNGFELLNRERKNLLNSDTTVYFNGEWKNIEIEFIGAQKKRGDSPNTTDIYSIMIDGTSIANTYSGKEMAEIEFKDNRQQAFINRICAWKKYLFEMETQDD
ncbi:MAG: hypothetical protein R3Y54_11410 [Eubacteriales bacterium]